MSRSGDPQDHGVDLEQVAGDGRPSAVLVLAVVVHHDELDAGWRGGPLPITQPTNDTTRARGHSRPTDAATRRTIVDAQQAAALYGDSDDKGTSTVLVRRHKLVRSREVIAVELLAVGPLTEESGEGFLVVHAAPTHEDHAVDSLQRFLRSCLRGDLGRAFRSALLAEVGPGVLIDDDAPARHMSFIPSREGEKDRRRVDPILAAYAVLSGDLATPWRDNARRAGAHTLTITKPDWSALVLRDGGAYVSHPTTDQDYGPTLRMLVHSIHTDALLLALLQRVMIDRSGSRSVTASLQEPEELVALEQSHFEFRRTLWRTALTKKRTAPPDVVLHTFQEELLTIADVLDVEDRVGDGARLAAALTARNQQKTLQAQQDAQASLNRTVQNTSVVIGSFALAFTAAPVITEPSWTAFWVAAAAGLVSMTAAFSVLTATGRRHKQTADARGGARA